MRKVHWTDSYTNSILAVLGMVFLWLLAYFLGNISYRDWVEWRQLEATGILTQGLILEIDQRGKGGQGVHYEYEVPLQQNGAKTFTRWEHINEELLAQVQEGGAVMVVYDPANPSLSRIDGNNNFPLLFAAVLPLSCAATFGTVGSILSLVINVRRKLVKLNAAKVA